MRYIFLRYPNGRAKAVTLSYDDGRAADVRMAETVTKYGLKCTFNLNGAALHSPSFRITDEQVRELILDAGHEVAVHGYWHRAPGAVRAAAGIRDVLDCRLDLEKRFGRIIRGMAYPDIGIRLFSNGSDFEGVKRYLRDLDIVYARTLGGDNANFRLPEDFLCWMPTAHHNNPALFDMVDQFLALDCTKIYSSNRHPRLFYLWGHSYEFDRDGNWDVIERFGERMGGRDDIWYATNIEIYDYVAAFHSLVFSADESIVYNPTLKDLWLDVDGRSVFIASGETLHIQ